MTPGKIVALVDGSDYSASVCDHAAWVAARTAAPVELLHVLGRREGADRQDLSGAVGLGARTALLEDLAELDRQRAKLMAARGRAILDDARARIEAAGVGAVTTQLRQGDLVETVAEAERGAGLVAIGKRGEAADFAKGHLGSNLERIVRAGRLPVLVASRAYRPVSRVLLAWDGGASAMRAADHIARDPLFRDLTLHVATVGADTPAVRESLARASATLASAGMAAQTSVLPGQPDRALGQLVEAERFDMVVMGAYGHSRMRSLIIGSTTTGLIRSCKVPVLLIR